MDLPSITPIIGDYELASQKLKLRKPTFQEAVLMQKWVSDGVSGLNLNLHIIASLMTGYQKSFEEKLEWLHSLPFESIDDVKETDSILAQLGFTASTSKKK